VNKNYRILNDEMRGIWAVVVPAYFLRNTPAFAGMNE
jgi:hypothetical protein